MLVIRDFREEENLHRGPKISQDPRQCRAIASVVAGSAEDEYRLALDRAAEFFCDDTCDGVSGIFHQHDGRNTIFLGRQTIDLTHLLSSQHLLHKYNIAHEIHESHESI